VTTAAVDASHRARARSVGAMAADVVGPLLLAAGALLHPAEHADPAARLQVIRADSTRRYVAHMMLMLGAALSIVAAARLARRLQHSRPTAGRIGRAATGAGFIAVLVFNGIEGLGGWALARMADRRASVSALHALTHTGGINGPLLAVTLLLPVGLAALAVAARAGHDGVVAVLLGAAALSMLGWMGLGVLPLLAIGGVVLGGAIGCADATFDEVRLSRPVGD